MAEPNLKIQMDFYHAQIVEGDLLRTFKRYFNHIAHIQGWIASLPTSVQQQLPQRPARFDEPGRLRLFDRLTFRASGYATIAVVRFEFP
jgi:hypothetical protein